MDEPENPETPERMLEVVARGYTAGARAADTRGGFWVGIMRGGKGYSRRTNEYARLGFDG